MSVIEELIDDDFIEDVSDAVGFDTGAWDMVDPKQICLETVRLYFKKIEKLEARGKQDETTE